MLQCMANSNTCVTFMAIPVTATTMPLLPFSDLPRRSDEPRVTTCVRVWNTGCAVLLNGLGVLCRASVRACEPPPAHGADAQLRCARPVDIACSMEVMMLTIAHAGQVHRTHCMSSVLTGARHPLAAYTHTML